MSKHANVLGAAKRPDQYLSNYEQWQQDRFGSILPDANKLPRNEQCSDDAYEERERFQEWVNEQRELQLIDHE